MTRAAEVLIDRDPRPSRGAPTEPIRPSIDDAWLAIAIAVPVLVILASALRTVDLAYHLRLGETIVATRSIPRVDSFTFTASGEPWLDQQWLAQAVLHLVHRGRASPG